MLPPKPIYSYISAAALALITIFTFYVFRDFGPQSVIRRFHVDVERGDQRDLNQIIATPVDPIKAQWIVDSVAVLVQSHATFQILDIKRLHREVLATVEYRYPNGNSQAVIWHVSQTPNDWRVDCGAMYDAMHGTP